jgi:hypothetical protein
MEVRVDSRSGHNSAGQDAGRITEAMAMSPWREKSLRWLSIKARWSGSQPFCSWSSLYLLQTRWHAIYKWEIASKENYIFILKNRINNLSVANTSHVRHVWLQECTFRSKKRKLELHSDGGNSCSMKCKWGYGSTCGGVWRSLRFAGVYRQAVGFVLVSLAEIWV